MSLFLSVRHLLWFTHVASSLKVQCFSHELDEKMHQILKTTSLFTEAMLLLISCLHVWRSLGPRARLGMPDGTVNAENRWQISKESVRSD